MIWLTTKSLLELVEMEVRDLLSEYDFPGDDVPVIKGSALKALEGEAEWEEKIFELMEAVDSTSQLQIVTLTSHS